MRVEVVFVPGQEGVEPHIEARPLSSSPPYPRRLIHDAKPFDYDRWEAFWIDSQRVTRLYYRENGRQ